MSKSERYEKIFNKAFENSWDNSPRKKPRKVKKPRIKRYSDQPKFVYIRKKDYNE